MTIFPRKKKKMGRATVMLQGIEYEWRLHSAVTTGNKQWEKNIGWKPLLYF